MILEDRPVFSVASRGLSVATGEPASKNAQIAAKKHGADLSTHQSTQLTEPDLSRSALVLTMAQSHKEQILSMYPQYADKVFTLSEFTGMGGDIKDPFMRPLEIYEECLEQILPMLHAVGGGFV